MPQLPSHLQAPGPLRAPTPTPVWSCTRPLLIGQWDVASLGRNFLQRQGGGETEIGRQLGPSPSVTCSQPPPGGALRGICSSPLGSRGSEGPHPRVLAGRRVGPGGSSWLGRLPPAVGARGHQHTPHQRWCREPPGTWAASSKPRLDKAYLCLFFSFRWLLSALVIDGSC